MFVRYFSYSSICKEEKEKEMAIFGTTGVVILIVAVALFGIRIVQQYDRAVKFTFGVYSGVVNPGLRWIIPLVQRLEVVDIRQRTIDLERQDVMTKDQVNLTIDGVVFYLVTNPANMILNVEHLSHQLQNMATAELKEIVGELNMSEALQKREYIAEQLSKKLEHVINDLKENNPEKRRPWGIEVRSIQINNIELPKSLVRAMAKEAEAEREKKAIIIRANGEQEAAKKYTQAASEYARTKNALELRKLKTYEEIGKEQNTLMLVIPEGTDTSNIAIPAAVSQLDKIQKKGLPPQGIKKD